ncbi:hypothetical protein AAE478_003850 [Parahypoxylon ruwenzoriense]
MPPVGKYALVAVLVGLAAFGFLNTIARTADNGLGQILNELSASTSTSATPGSPDAPQLRVGAPSPFKTSYTGVGPLDAQLAVLVGFFAALLDDAGARWSHVGFYVWALAQLAAGWTAVLLEGRRAGSRGRAVAWVGTVGLVFQNATWTLTVPLWLALHLVSSPVAALGAEREGRERGDAARRALFVYLWDLALIPLAVTLGYLAPTVTMGLPRVFGHDAATHYTWVAIWQAFPLWTVLILDILHNACYFLFGSLSPLDGEGKPTTPGNGFMTAVADVYKFGLTICAATHAPLLLVSLLPAALRTALSAALPSLAPVLADLTFARTFVPYAPSAAPTVDPASYGPGDLAPLVTHFLQYDLYTGNAALLLWALYLNWTTAGAGAGRRARALRTTALWLLVGGPGAAALALLWERDGVVRDGEGEGEEKTK